MAKNSFLLLFLLFCVSFICGVLSQYELEELTWLDDRDDEISMFHNQHSAMKRCDFTSGKWVFDQSYPLYDSTCPYLSTAVTCTKNGRPDSDYEKWRWKPHACEIPRYWKCHYFKKKLIWGSIGFKHSRNAMRTICIVDSLPDLVYKRTLVHRA